MTKEEINPLQTLFQNTLLTGITHYEIKQIKSI